MREFTYKIIKTSWGIHVTIKAYWKELSAYDGAAHKVSEKLFFATEEIYVFEELIPFLQIGFRLMAEKFDERFKHREPVIILIKEVDFNLCDYQPEGIACAITGWISEEFEIPAPPVEVHFDKSNNRYVFDFQAGNL